MSKRAFDGRIKAWRRALHKWDPSVTDQETADLNSSFDGDISIQSGSAADNISLTPRPGSHIPDNSSGALQKPSSSSGAAKTVTPDTVTDSSIVSTGENKKDILGAQLYPLIFAHQPELAAKITGMLLELDDDEIAFLISSSNDLLNRIREAFELLRDYSTEKSGFVYAMESEREQIQPAEDVFDDIEEDNDDVL
jgi:hypothetical protein